MKKMLWYRPAIRWYNPATRTKEYADAPMADAQAIEMLSGDPDSSEFIAVYRRLRESHSIVEALIYTGEHFRNVYGR